MTLVEAARASLRTLEPDRIRDLVCRRLEGLDSPALGPAVFPGDQEEVVAELLRQPDLPVPQRAALIAGCTRIYERFLVFLARREGGGPEAVPLFLRLCRVVDQAAPPELLPLATAALALALAWPELAAELRAAAVRARQAFVHRGEAAGPWVPLLEDRELCTYGFQALVAADPDLPFLDEALVRLFRRQLEDGWQIDASYLAHVLARRQGSRRVVMRVLARLRAALPAPSWVALLGGLAARSWGREWLEALPGGGASGPANPAGRA